MRLLPRKNILAIAAVIDIALNAGDGPVSGKEVAARHHLPPRHLEPVLQALVREGILKGVRGPHGGYKLAREARRITAADILRAARTMDDGTETPIPGSSLVSQVVAPALAEAENVFSSALARLSVADLTAHALRRVAAGSRRLAVGGSRRAVGLSLKALASFGPPPHRVFSTERTARTIAKSVMKARPSAVSTARTTPA